MNGFALIAIAVTMWAFGSGIVAKVFSVPALMWYPAAAAIAMVITGLILCWKTGSLKQLWPDAKPARWLLIGCGATVVINNGLFFTALQISSVPVAQLTHYLAPLFLAVIFAPLLLGEKPTRREVILTMIGLAGLIVVLWPDLSQSRLSLGAVFGAISAVFFAIGTVFNRKLTRYGVSGLSTAVYNNIVPAFAMFPFLIWYLNQGVNFTSADWWGVAYMGVFAIGIAFSIYLIGLERVKKANHAGIMSYGEPVGAIILAAIFMSEPLTPYVIVGAILIISSGIALVLTKEKS